MYTLLIQWILSAVALLVVARIVPGFHVGSFASAMVAAAVIGLLNATFGVLVKVLTLPLSILTLGVFLLVVNGLMILVASRLVSGFDVEGILPAFWGAAVLALLGMAIRAVTEKG